MATANKKPGDEIKKLATEIMGDPKASQVQKSFAGSCLACVDGRGAPSDELVERASGILTADWPAANTKRLAASIVARARKS